MDFSKFVEKGLPLPVNTEKIQNARQSPIPFSGKYPKHSFATFVCVSMLCIHSEIALGGGIENWHIFSFEMAYFPAN